MSQAILKVVTIEQAINSPKNDYNPSEWKRTVMHYTKYQDVSFYMNEDGRTYVRYTLEEGLQLFAEISFSGGVNNGGFAMVFFIVQPDGSLRVSTQKFLISGQFGYADNNKQNRKLIAQSGIHCYCAISTILNL